MSIDPRYVATLDLQEYFVDKDSGLPLAGGIVTFYEDNSRGTKKPVFELTGDPPDYTFTQLPNPLILSAVGTVQDPSGADIIFYGYPFDEEGNPQLYYITVESSGGVPQFTRDAWPPNQDAGGTPTGQLTNVPNFIPNGQFLIHNTIEPDNILQGGSTPIAPGGWTIELPDDVLSTNVLVFTPIPAWTTDPPASPPYKVTFSCIVPNSSDAFKTVRIKFNDVNTFASDSIPYEFAFWAESNAANTTVTVQIVKYFGVGGSSFTPVPIGTFEITSTGQFISVPVVFGDNAGYTVGTGQTYVALEIAFSTSQAFNVSMTDAVLAQTDEPILDYPVQTNADTITRTVMGWSPVPDYGGFDLYLPLINTATGQTYDSAQIGDVGGSVGLVELPTQTDPIPQHNKMPTNGDSYLMNGFSANGIPYARLGQYLITNSAVPYVPLYGTGLDFATAYAYAGNTEILRLTVNSAGTPILGARDGNTGWNFSVIVNYNGSVEGSDSLDYSAYSQAPGSLLAVGNFITPDFNATDGTTPFTVSTLSFTSDILAQQAYAFVLTATSGLTLVQPSAPGLYWTFSNSTQGYYMWFSTGNGETDPAPGGGLLPIAVYTDSALTSVDVANVIREVLNAYQITNIIPAALPLASQYWLFSSNPSAPVNYYVWYIVAGIGTDPMVSGATGIPVSLVGDETLSEIVTVTQATIDSWQYAAPAFDGMFLRMSDFSGKWDTDVAFRWSTVSGLSGANNGTFEFQQILQHYHSLPGAVLLAGAGQIGGPGDETLTDLPTRDTGGSETRPVNTYVNGYIRY